MFRFSRTVGRNPSSSHSVSSSSSIPSLLSSSSSPCRLLFTPSTHTNTTTTITSTSTKHLLRGINYTTATTTRGLGLWTQRQAQIQHRRWISSSTPSSSSSSSSSSSTSSSFSTLTDSSNTNSNDNNNDDNNKNKLVLSHLQAEMSRYRSGHNSVTMRQLFDAGVHLGHKRNLWHPNIKPYLYGEREKIHIIDLEQTVIQLRNALKLLRKIAYDGGVIVFVCMKPAFENLIVDSATRCGEYYVTKKWIPGTLTNRLTTHLTSHMPDCVVFFNAGHCVAAVNETNSMTIPTVGIADTDIDPHQFAYPICGNDDSMSAMRLYTTLMEKAILEGKLLKKKGVVL